MRRTRHGQRSGFTLIELLISMVIFSVIMTSVYVLVMRTQRQYTQQRDRIRVQESLRHAELVLTRVLRNARPDPMNKNLGLIDPDYLDVGLFNNVRVVGDFNPADGDTADPLEDVQFHAKKDTLFVRWQAGQATQALAAPVRGISFEYYGANGALLTSEPQIVGAVRVKITITVPRKDGSGVISRRDAWVYLRNT